jgi:hypothetical protein
MEKLVSEKKKLPPVVRKRLVGFRHFVRVFALFDGATRVVCGIRYLARKPKFHHLFASFSRKNYEPTKRKRKPSLASDLNRNLIVRAADPPRFDLKAWGRVIDCGFQNRNRVFAGFFADCFKRAVNYRLRNALFSVKHYVIYEPRYDFAFVNRVDLPIPFCRSISS